MFKECLNPPKKSEFATIDQELNKMLSIMDIAMLTFSLSQAEWKSVARIFLKAIQARLERSPHSNEP